MAPRIGRAIAGVALASAATLGLTLAYAQESPENAAPTSLPAASAPVESSSNTAAAAPALPEPIQPAMPQKTIAPSPPQPPGPPPGPPSPVRSSAAILRVLDKVTAETLRFEAPVGRRVRYKSLIFLVKACETRGPDDPLPRPSAYVVVDLEPQSAPGLAAPAIKEIYRGWMFANAPGLHLFEHPVFDAWLESCTSATPPT